MVESPVPTPPGALHLYDNTGRGNWHLPAGPECGGLVLAGPGLDLPAAVGLVLTLEPHREGRLWTYPRALERLWSRGNDVT
jgi:hypothetical protein